MNIFIYLNNFVKCLESCGEIRILYKNKNFVILFNTMIFKMNGAKYTIAILAILGISGLLYASSFLQFGIAQNNSGNNAGSQKKDVGSQQDLKNLTKGNQELFANSSSISNSSVSGISKESSVGKPNMTKETGQSQSGQSAQNQTSQSGQSAQNQTSQSKGPLDFLSNLMGGKK